MNNKSKQIKKFFFLACVPVLFIVGVSVINNNLINNAIRNNELQFNHNQFIQTEIASQAIRQLISVHASVYKIFANYSMVEFATGKRSRESIGVLFDTEHDGDKCAVGFFYFDQKGKMVLSGTKHDFQHDRYMSIASYFYKNFHSQLAAGPARVLVPPFYVKPDTQLFSMMFKVSAEGKDCGVFMAIMDLKPYIDEFIIPMKSGEYGSGYLLNENGTVLYDGEIEIIGQNVFTDLHQQDPALMELDKKLVTTPDGMDEYCFTTRRGSQRSRKLIAWNSVDIGGRKLVICLSAPDMEVDSAIKEAKTLQLLSNFMTLLLAVSAIFFYYRHISLHKVQQSEERMKMALEGTGDGVWDWNPKTGEALFSHLWKKMLGFEDKDISNHISEWQNRVHPMDKLKTMKALKAHLDGTTPQYSDENRVRCKDGSYKWILSRGKVLDRDISGNPVRVVGTQSDITARKLAELEVSRLSTALERCPSAIIITDPDGVMVYVNASFENIYGFSRKEVLGKRPNILKSSHQPQELYTDMWQTIASGGQWRGELVNKTKSGQEVWVRVSISPVFDENGEVINYVGAQEDISELKKREDALRRLATTDELTRIFNRRKFLELAEMEFRRSKRLGQALSLIIFDLDHFKKVNDTYGHNVGDLVLRELAQVAEKGIRDIDTIARIGGEEFAVLLPQAGIQGGAVVAERLRRKVEAHSIATGTGPIKLTISLGVAGLCWEDSTIHDLINLADKAMYQAKEKGRNRVCTSNNRENLIGSFTSSANPDEFD